ncbi:rhodanese-like domain-containing protein [Paenisporosarcina antarctica]|uniref:Rhodanese-like domain-containing protein n=1 Tax=Paenisporosarcina antarctica TaxID=417367 RepID=A0A4P6ZX83_9BACL|nr:rhodanese-like domain-containing protein [Paenisporosarcina antarctica]QBP41230.1 rhodanese-like domain-containing protein [Paenisporosarcina antarctica]
MKKFIIFLFVVIFTLTACSSSATYETIAIDDIPLKVEEGYKVIDVRETGEYGAGHIPGSLNKPLSEIKNGDIEGLDKNQKYIVICQSGNRSKEASSILFDEDFMILNVSEGMSSWTGPVEKK